MNAYQEQVRRSVEQTIHDHLQQDIDRGSAVREASREIIEAIVNDDSLLRSAINEFTECGHAAFLTSNSCGPESHYEVTAKFQSLEDMQSYYGALINLLKTASLNRAVQPA